MFFTVRLFHSSLIFSIMLKANTLHKSLKGFTRVSFHPCLQVETFVEVGNDLAYYDRELITTVRRFQVEVPEVASICFHVGNKFWIVVEHARIIFRIFFNSFFGATTFNLTTLSIKTLDVTIKMYCCHIAECH